MLGISRIVVIFKKLRVQFISGVSCTILGYFKCSRTVTNLNQNVSLTHHRVDALTGMA